MATPPHSEEPQGPSSHSEDLQGASSPSVDANRASADTDHDDESPDLGRLAVLAGILLVLVGVWLWSALHPPARKFYANMPGLRLDRLSAAQREQVLKEANAMMCDCGSSTCHYSVAECRHMEETQCDVSLRLAAVIIRKVTGGEPEYTQAMPSAMQGRAAPAAATTTPASAAPVSASPATR